MKRMVLAYAAAGLVGVGVCAGCSSSGGGQPMNDPFSKKLAEKQPRAEYFELRREGKVYVLGSPDSLKRFNEGQTPAVKAVPDLGGKTVYVENTKYTTFNRLLADYKKQHSL